MKSSSYWKKRFEQLEQAQNKLGLDCYAEIEQQYRQAQKTIEGQIASWYQRFADNNSISLADARKLLTNKELAELKWDINDYIKYGKENKVNGAWMKELENASAKYHISRLESLKLQTQQNLEVMFGNQIDSVDSHMRDIYKNDYYRTAYEIQKGVGVGWDLVSLDNRTISKVLSKPWAADGRNFSERIWGNRQKLMNEMNNILTQNIILGQDPQKAINAIAKKMSTSKTAAGRLVMTEEAFFSSAARKDCFKELDVEQYEIVATLDSRTSEICRDMDGKVFKMSEWEVGVTAPPFHVYCRSTTAPYFEDDFGEAGRRSARGENGKTYYVDADMTYKEWKEAFVDGGDKSGLQEIGKDDTINSVQEGKKYTNVVKSEENKIYAEDIETAVLIDSKGDVVFKKSSGAKSYVKFTNEEAAMMKGTTLTHNHPSGSTFSSTDISLLTKHELKTIRATGKERTYQLSRNKSKININFADDYQRAQIDNKKITDAEHKKLKKLCESGQISFTEYNKSLYDLNKQLDRLNSDWLKENAKNYGYRYSVIERRR